MTTFMNLMVVLVPFLLITAVFSRITILELNLPTGAGPGGAPDKPTTVIEVIVREAGIEIGNGKTLLVRMPKVDEAYDIKTLTEYLLKIKAEYADKTDATVLMEADIEYESLVTVMDAVREVAIFTADKPGVKQIVQLFPDISIGDAP